MKIIFVDTSLSGDIIGGAQTFLVGCLRELVEKGHDVHFVISGEPNEKLRKPIQETNVTIHTNLWNRRSLAEDATPAFAGWVNDLKPDAYVVSVSPDVGWTTLPHLNAEIATVAIVHSDSRGFYDPLRHYSGFVTNAIGVSQEICRQFELYCGRSPENATWIPYGVAAMAGEPEADESSRLNLVYVGRLAEEDKKASDVIRIARTLSERNFDYSLKVIGDGPLMSDFKAELASEIAAGKVEMMGWLNSHELIDILRRSAVSLLVSESEGFCIALVEEMANGCCPIVTDIKSGNKQLVRDSENGFVLPIGDINGFADKIASLASDRDSLLRMRRAAWATGREYSVDRMVDSYVECFERAVADARANPRMPDPDFPLMESCRSKYPLWLRRIKAKAKSLAAG